MTVEQIAIGAASLIVVLAAACDLRTRRIPNVLTVTGVLLGFAIAIAAGAVDDGVHGALAGFARTLLGVAVCAGFPAWSFARGEMGGGDVKLFAAVGALCGPGLGLDAEGFTFATSLVLVLPFRLARHGQLRTALANGAHVLRSAFRRGASPVPYPPFRLPPVVMGPTIALGLCMAIARRGALP